MQGPTGSDPVRATLVAILRQLNQAETVNEGRSRDQALELTDIERKLSDFWAVDQGSVKVSLALGLLLRNGLVEAAEKGEFSWKGPKPVPQRYQITAEGKKFLIESIQSSDRIS